MEGAGGEFSQDGECFERKKGRTPTQNGAPEVCADRVENFERKEKSSPRYNSVAQRKAASAERKSLQSPTKTPLLFLSSHSGFYRHLPLSPLGFFFLLPRLVFLSIGLSPLKGKCRFCSCVWTLLRILYFVSLHETHRHAEA